MPRHDVKDAQAYALRSVGTLASSTQAVERAEAIIVAPANSEKVGTGSGDTDVVINDQCRSCKTNCLAIQ